MGPRPDSGSRHVGSIHQSLETDGKKQDRTTNHHSDTGNPAVKPGYGANVAPTFGKGPGLNVDRNILRHDDEATYGTMSSGRGMGLKGKSKVPEARRPLSPSKRFKGKPGVSKMRGYYPSHVRGVSEPSEFDAEEYAGVVKVDLRGRFDILDPVGTDVARAKDGVDGPLLVPGKVIGVKRLKGRSTGATFRVVYLDGFKEMLDEATLRWYANTFNQASTKVENPIKPIIAHFQ